MQRRNIFPILLILIGTFSFSACVEKKPGPGELMGRGFDQMYEGVNELGKKSDQEREEEKRQGRGRTDGRDDYYADHDDYYDRRENEGRRDERDFKYDDDGAGRREDDRRY